MDQNKAEELQRGIDGLAAAPILVFEHHLKQDLSIRSIMGEQGNPAFNQPLLKRFVDLMGAVDPEPLGIDPMACL